MEKSQLETDSCKGMVSQEISPSASTVYPADETGAYESGDEASSQSEPEPEETCDRTRAANVPPHSFAALMGSTTQQRSDGPPHAHWQALGSRLADIFREAPEAFSEDEELPDLDENSKAWSKVQERLLHVFASASDDEDDNDAWP
eukprot:CAMPEP_0197631048 /NCGR_PEP_ID=MMETSP1338-20131121/8351_1 /TAXON_ID=43686 ORGANISM="Pelagodinium beii, Strain RCC1491" /NCGR_SAMPLE_ID=MMETSP1338 /ASSEMBLY_ACC=CAM_ASM_000754 /LENGTH=145 /DNA_ID=CAMNT_0043202427 /DNA_START=114 /DNA_END=551 /DNA_ORIENTATION=+